MQNQIVIFCICTISIKLKELAHKATEINSIDINISYEISCAAERKLTKKAYFELIVNTAPIIT